MKDLKHLPDAQLRKEQIKSQLRIAQIKAARLQRRHCCPKGESLQDRVEKSVKELIEAVRCRVR
jgi:hypothetical protein